MEILGIVLIFALAVFLAIPMGRYISRVYAGEKTILDFISPVEQKFAELTRTEHLTGSKI